MSNDMTFRGTDEYKSWMEGYQAAFMSFQRAAEDGGGMAVTAGIVSHT